LLTFNFHDCRILSWWIVSQLLTLLLSHVFSITLCLLLVFAFFISYYSHQSLVIISFMIPCLLLSQFFVVILMESSTQDVSVNLQVRPSCILWRFANVHSLCGTQTNTSFQLLLC
jgi:hypothetical protein